MVSEVVRDTRELQEMREVAQLDMGVERYYSQVSKQGAGEVTAGLGLVYTAMHVLIPEITEQVRILESGETHPSKVQQAVHYMCGMNPDAMAYITAKVCITAAAQRSKLTRTAMKIANLIEEDYRFEQLEQAEPALANSMSRKAAKWSTSGARRRIMRKAAQIAGVQGMGWTEGEKLRLGMALLEMFVKLTGFAELDQEKDGTRTTKLFVLTPEASERLNDRHLQLQAERPVNTPMIHPPKKWTSPTNGGYLTERMKMNLVRSIGMETRDDLMSADLTEVYNAVNAVQATRWCINNEVLRVLRQVYNEGGTLGGLPERDDIPLPERPDSVDRKLDPEKMPEKMKATFTEWKQRARETYEYNAKLASKRHALGVKLRLAEELRSEEAIYFPHSLDFRGRIYSMSSELSPQSDDVAKSLPQDGRIKLNLSQKKSIDFRVSTCPIMFGEKVVLRILDSSATRLGVEGLGFDPGQQESFKSAVGKPYGMILATGPTGSGKTVTLYTALNILNDVGRNISTVEDPVEIRVPGINQVQQNVKQGMTFASALRSFLRQDPDVIMVGEIRDLETAEIGIKAAQTGHLVFSTLHTNDAPQSITRLMNMGVPTYNITSAVNLVIAQRLLRQLHKCKQHDDMPKEALLRAGFSEDKVEDLKIYKPVGCAECHEGYRGRTGVFEVMPISDNIARVILEEGNAMQIARIAREEGINDLRRSALIKVAAGVTDLIEINRVTKD